MFLSWQSSHAVVCNSLQAYEVLKISFNTCRCEQVPVSVGTEPLGELLRRGRPVNLVSQKVSTVGQAACEDLFSRSLVHSVSVSHKPVSLCLQGKCDKAAINT